MEARRRNSRELDRSRDEVSHRWPQILADRRTLLFTVWTGPGWDEKHLEVQVGDGGEHRRLVPGASTGRYISTGHLLYSKADNLIVAPFDLASLTVTGPPVTLVERARDGVGEGAQYAVSDIGHARLRAGTVRCVRASPRLGRPRRHRHADPGAAGCLHRSGDFARRPIGCAQRAGNDTESVDLRLRQIHADHADVDSKPPVTELDTRRSSSRLPRHAGRLSQHLLALRRRQRRRGASDDERLVADAIVDVTRRSAPLLYGNRPGHRTRTSGC